MLNETTKQLTITMGNPNPLPVNYHWSFVEDGDQSDEESRMALQSTSPLQNTTLSAPSERLGPDTKLVLSFRAEATHRMSVVSVKAKRSGVAPWRRRILN